MCVRKLWYSLIKSPSFVSLHLSHSLVDPHYYIFLVHDSSALFQFALIPDTPHVTSPLPDTFDDTNFKIGNESVSLKEKEISGACRGLICLTNSDHSEEECIYLINPFVRKCKKVQVRSSDLIGIGFGYREIDDDYKVVRIVRVFDRKCVEIYSLKSGEWKIVDFSMEIELPVLGKAVFAHGCLYWCVNEEKHSNLLCFSLEDEVFSNIELPETYRNLSSTHDSRMFNRNDSVVIVLYNEWTFTKIKITLLVMERDFDGHVQWRELSYSSKNGVNDSEDEEEGGDGDGDGDGEDEGEGQVRLCPLGFNSHGRLIIEMSSQGTYEMNRSIFSVNLDNSFAMEEFTFSFDTKPQIQSDWAEDVDCVDGVTNVMESLVLFSD